jgi:hypothetical protein
MKITRRNLLKRALALPFVAASGAAVQSHVTTAKPAASRTYLLNLFTIAGFQYYPGPALVFRQSAGKKAGSIPRRDGPDGFPHSFAPLPTESGPILPLKAGSDFDLIPEPQNPYDEFAVRIDYCGIKIGYVPRSDNRHISRLQQQGARLCCRAVEVNPDVEPWNMVRVEVGMVF